jgi:hypothetical protein
MRPLKDFDALRNVCSMLAEATAPKVKSYKSNGEASAHILQVAASGVDAESMEKFVKDVCVSVGMGSDLVLSDADMKKMKPAMRAAALKGCIAADKKKKDDWVQEIMDMLGCTKKEALDAAPARFGRVK